LCLDSLIITNVAHSITFTGKVIMVRTWLVLLILLNGAALAAQNMITVGGVVNADSRHFKMLEIDHGSSMTALDIDLNLSTSDMVGLFARITDLDLASTLTTPFRGEDLSASGSAGTVSFTLSLPARIGKHLLLYEVNDASTTTSASTTYTGTVSCTAGTLTEIDTKYEDEIFIGMRSHWDRVLDYHVDFTTDLTPIQVGWNYTSSTTQTTFGSVGLFGYGIGTWGFSDTKTSPAQVLQFGSGAARTGYVLNEVTLSNGSWSGSNGMRLDLTRTGPGLVDLRVFSSDEAFVFWILSRDKNGNSGGNSSCSTEAVESPTALFVAVICGLLVAVRLRRRRA